LQILILITNLTLPSAISEEELGSNLCRETATSLPLLAVTFLISVIAEHPKGCVAISAKADFYLIAILLKVANKYLFLSVLFS